jgi:CubicO group peptidase (beta-lactamase class C family)
VAIGIFDHGVVSTRGLGVTNVEEPLPITEHTVFPIASISKTFAATAMMRLVEQGKIDLQAPVRKYLPDFKVRDEKVASDVTIWNLLTHSPGWEGQLSGPERGEDTLRNFVATVMADAMQIAPPAAAWSYNNAAYSTAGRVIEVVNGTSINRALRDLVFRPLGLAHAGTTAGDFIVNRFAAGHANRGDAPALMRPYTHATSVTSGGVGLCIADLMTYAKFHLGDGTNASGERILARATLDRMQTPQLEKQSTDDAIGLGWHIRRAAGVRVAGQGGTAGGHILVLSIVPERNFAIGILTNAQNGWRLIQDVEREALRAYHTIVYAKNQAIDATGSRSICRQVPPPHERHRRARGRRPPDGAGRSQHRRAAARGAHRVLRPRSRGGHGRQRSRPVDRVHSRCQRRREMDPRRRAGRCQAVTDHQAVMASSNSFPSSSGPAGRGESFVTRCCGSVPSTSVAMSDDE